MLAPPYGGIVGSHPDRLGDQHAGGSPVRTRQKSLVDVDCQVPNRSWAIRENGGIAAGDVPAWARTQVVGSGISQGGIAYDPLRINWIWNDLLDARETGCFMQFLIRLAMPSCGRNGLP